MYSPTPSYTLNPRVSLPPPPPSPPCASISDAVISATISQFSSIKLYRDRKQHLTCISLYISHIMYLAVCGATSLLIIWGIHWVYRWMNPKCNGRLPPGSMGLPFIGETLQFFAPNTSWGIPTFITQRMERYGPMFKTSLVGRPVVVSTDPEFNYFVIQQEGRMFQSWYPYSFTEIFGHDNVGSLHGFMYKYLKSLVLKLFGTETLREVLLPEVDEAARSNLLAWSGKSSVELKDATAKLIFDLTAKRLISYDPSTSSESLRNNFLAFIRGLISFPLYIPGTAYHQCIQGRKKAMKVMKKMLTERQNSPRKQATDFFDYLIEELKKERTILTENIALDLMFVLLFASFETTSLALTAAVKFLTDNPAALDELTAEHEAIVKKRENPDSGITWDEYKSMTFTFQVIHETARLANIVPGMFRKAMKDIQINGYTIPAGWGVMVCPPAVHLNPEIYKDALTFNPWRWKGSTQMTGGAKHFMAFGGGVRFCVGTDFAKLQMAVFLHHLVTKYRWRPIKGGSIVKTPGLSFPDGYHIQLEPKD